VWAQKLLERIDRKVQTGGIGHVAVIDAVVHLHLGHMAAIRDNSSVGELQGEIGAQIGAELSVRHLQKLLCEKVKRRGKDQLRKTKEIWSVKKKLKKSKIAICRLT